MNLASIAVSLHDSRLGGEADRRETRSLQAADPSLAENHATGGLWAQAGDCAKSDTRVSDLGCLLHSEHREEADPEP